MKDLEEEHAGTARAKTLRQKYTWHVPRTAQRVHEADARTIRGSGRVCCWRGGVRLWEFILRVMGSMCQEFYLGTCNRNSRGA